MIIIQGEEMDFGDMEFGKSYTKDFRITNRGDKPLTITSLGKSCTCTEAWTDSTIVQPQKDGIIHVRVTPGSKGLFLRSFWFTAGATHTIKLKGKVV
jgi:hypothetical protein